MSLGYFPIPYPDEVLYSVIARAKSRLGIEAARTFVFELFGTIHIRAVLDMPSHLDAMATALPPGYPLSVDDWIDDHTLLPFYAPFVQPEKLPGIRAAMRGAGKHRINPKIGAMSHRVPVAEQLRYCPACVEADRAAYAEAYWHRVHQLPGVEVCPHHNCWLQTSAVSVRGERKKHLYIAAESADIATHPITAIDETNPDHVLLLAFARDALWLLGQVDLTVGPRILLEKYRTALANHRLATSQGRLYPQQLFSVFAARYSKSLLQRWRCELGDDPETSWLIVRTLRTGRHVSTPLENWLLINFLNADFDTFLTNPVHLSLFDHAFGHAPWPCLNPICPDYHQPVIPHWTIQTIRMNQPTAHFTCPTCGYTYSRLGPDSQPEDRHRVGHVITYGDLWKSELRRLWYDDQMSFNKMAEALRVAKLTLRQQGQQMGLPFPMPGSRKIGFVPEPVNREPQFEEHRAIWLKALADNPNAGVHVLRQQRPSTFYFLSQYDADWLQSHRPHDKRRIGRQHLDWDALDAELPYKVVVAAEAQLASLDCPVRITPTLLSRAVGYRVDFFADHKTKLPNTWEVIHHYGECTTDVAIRRIRWHATQLMGQPFKMTRLKFAVRAAAEGHLHDSSVEHALNEVYQMLCEQSIAGEK